MTGTYILCIVVAALLGGAIGLEREYRSKEAGFRTHFLVGLGSGLLMVLSMHGFDDFMGIQGIQRDPSRMAAQVISGMGFIGAGCIIFQKNVSCSISDLVYPAFSKRLCPIALPAVLRQAGCRPAPAAA